MSGTSGNDVLCGLGGNDVIRGLTGDDVLVGGPGTDTLIGGPGADDLIGGDGSDLVRYDDRNLPVVVTIGVGADDGPVGEADEVSADVERIWGSPADDRIVNATTGAVQLRGFNGHDVLTGGPGPDILEGAVGHDVLRGRRGQDSLNCGRGSDGFSNDGTDSVAANCEHRNPSVPVAGRDLHATQEDVAIRVSAAALLANDDDPDDDELFLQSVHSDHGGSVTLSQDLITFEPALNFSGRALFYYSVTDGDHTSLGRVDVDVAAIDDPPVAGDDGTSIEQDETLTLATSTLLVNDRDVDSRMLTVLGVSGFVNGTAAISGGTVTFVPTSGFCGTAGFDYTVTDGHSTDIGHVEVAVACKPPPPPPPHITAGEDELFGHEDTLLSVPVADLLANDSDVDGHPLTITHAISDVGDAWVDGGTVFLRPDPEECNLLPGSSHHPFALRYTVTDGTELGYGWAEVWLTCVNDPPDVWWEFGSVAMDGRLVVTMSDIPYYDPDVDRVFLVAVGNPAHGSVTLSDGSITFVPDPGYCGDEAAFDYVVSDGQLEDTGRYYVSVYRPHGSC